MLEELNYQEMREIKGGDSISVAEYCALLIQLIQDNPNMGAGAIEGAMIGYAKHCVK